MTEAVWLRIYESSASVNNRILFAFDDSYRMSHIVWLIIYESWASINNRILSAFDDSYRMSHIVWFIIYESWPSINNRILSAFDDSYRMSHMIWLISTHMTHIEWVNNRILSFKNIKNIYTLQVWKSYSLKRIVYFQLKNRIFSAQKSYTFQVWKSYTLENRIVSAEKSYTFRKIIVYFQSKNRILSAVIVYFTYDPSIRPAVHFKCHNQGPPSESVHGLDRPSVRWSILRRIIPVRRPNPSMRWTVRTKISSTSVHLLEKTLVHGPNPPMRWTKI